MCQISPVVLLGGPQSADGHLGAGGHPHLDHHGHRAVWDEAGVCVSCLFVCLFVGWLVGWLVCLLACLFVCLVACLFVGWFVCFVCVFFAYVFACLLCFFFFLEGVLHTNTQTHKQTIQQLDFPASKEWTASVPGLFAACFPGAFG